MTPETLSIRDMFIHADPVVQIVMILLFLASLLCWVIIIQKCFLIRWMNRQIRISENILNGQPENLRAEDYPVFFAPVIHAGLEESRDAAGGESRADFRNRVERAMKAVFFRQAGQAGHYVSVLASIGSVSPFVGLFGTVWGIMNSFISIAAAGETSLNVVAPGIAEALFATAMGLVAAIPAVLAYNQIINALKGSQKEALFLIALAGNNLAHSRYSEEERKNGHAG
jgi:Biopolymer transport proteins